MLEIRITRYLKEIAFLSLIPFLYIIIHTQPCRASDYENLANRYIFVSDQSTIVQTGGIAGVHWTYNVSGQFVLKVDSKTGKAFFEQVDANAVDDSPYNRTLDPNEIFAMTSLAGVVLNDTTIDFTGKAKDNSDIHLTITFQGSSLQITANTVPPQGSADYFIYNLDAIAQCKYSGGTGEPNEPYYIATSEDLIALGNEPNDYDKHFKLIHDIDLSDYVFDKAVIAPDMDPLSKSNKIILFSGVFDGNGHKVSNLKIEGQDIVGLFGISSGEVRNLGVIDVNITGWESMAGIGGLMATNEGIVTKCYSTGIVKATGIQGSSTGGLIGTIYEGNVTQCKSSTTIVSNNMGYSGGLVGSIYSGNVSKCYSTGKIINGDYVGGLIGMKMNARGSNVPSKAEELILGYRNLRYIGWCWA